MEPGSLLDSLPAEQRLALAYAPAASRFHFIAFFALDARLAGVVRRAREPMLGQIRLAWWRERLERSEPDRTGGEPLLEALVELGEVRAGLTPLVDGWEAMLGAMGGDGIEPLVNGRARALTAIMLELMAPEALASAARQWAVADICARTSNETDRAAALALAAREGWQRIQLPRAMRPLAVLHALARRRHDGRPLLDGFGALPLAIRVGLTGL